MWKSRLLSYTKGEGNRIELKTKLNQNHGNKNCRNQGMPVLSYSGPILICCLHLTLVPGARIGKKYDKSDQLIGETFPFSVATLLIKANQFLAK